MILQAAKEDSKGISARLIASLSINLRNLAERNKWIGRQIWVLGHILDSQVRKALKGIGSGEFASSIILECIFA